jgi:phosphoribosylformylglycinamidine synthase
LDGSRWATERRDHRIGTLPALDLARHGVLCEFVAGLVSAIVGGDPEPPLLSAVHDVSSGGLAVCLGEMAVAAGVGCSVALDDPAELFCELPSRFVLATATPDELCERAANLGIPAAVLGRAAGDRFRAGELVDLPVGALSQAHEGNLAALLGDT